MNKRLLIAALLPFMGSLVSTPLMADNCTPYINGMANSGNTFNVHGTKLYYEGNYPEHWHFSVLTAANLGAQPPLSDDTDHFEVHRQWNTSTNVHRQEFIGYFTEAKSSGSASSYHALVLQESFDGGEAKAYLEAPSGYRTYMPMEDCYRINDNPNQFAMKGQYNNGSWVYNNWLFSIERVDE